MNKGTALFLLLVLPLAALAQGGQPTTEKGEKMRYSAERLVNGRNDTTTYKRLIGNVVLKQKQTTIYCDSAYFYDQRNAMEGFGNVRIVQTDSITITGDRLDYDGDARLANVRQEVVYRDPSLRIFTDHLQYDVANNMAYYFGGGKVVDELNTLSSDQASYHTKSKISNFRKDMVLVNPDYTMRGDTLSYNSNTKTATTLGPTDITTTNGTVLHAEIGSEYDTSQGTSVFLRSNIETESYYIYGEELFANETDEYYQAQDNANMVAKEQELIITGEQARYWRAQGLTKVYDQSLMRRLMEADTFYLSADTLVSLEDSIPANERILAYKDVRIYKSDMQGRSDSMAYFLADSVITLYGDPILWSQGTQLTADTIHILIRNGTIDRMLLRQRSFVISRDTLTNANQMKGRNMVAYFDQGNIYRLDVEGNGESIYWALDENDNTLIGMNRILCSNMRIHFKENQVTEIYFLKKPEAQFFPPHELQRPDTRLSGFDWRGDGKPAYAEMAVRMDAIEGTDEAIGDVLKRKGVLPPTP